jgi:glycerol-1-phosphate dehydrogenase [NAD(P)+]
LPFDLLREDEAVLLDAAEDLIGGDLAAMRVLVRTLTLSGFGTAIVGSSAPASQAEHLVSHFIDMMAPADRPAVFHGEQVGLTTISIARLYEAMLEQRPRVSTDTVTPEAVRATFGGELTATVWPEVEAKRLDAQQATALNDRLAADWDGIANAVRAVLLPARRIEAVLRNAGGPLTPEAIFLDRGFYESALRHGREIRNRYTILDLAAQSGRLEPMLSSL